MKIKNYYSKISGPLEITYLNGKKTLNTRNANYSYGALQRVLHQGLRHISFGPNFQNILVLGMGGGSIVETVRDDFNSKADITLVEIDSEMIRVAKEEFDILSYPMISIVHADAATFVKEVRQTFDLVIVDLFIQENIPANFTEKEFLDTLTGLIAVEGRLIYNTMRTSLSREVRGYIQGSLEEAGLKVDILERVGSFNDLILGVKMENR